MPGTEPPAPGQYWGPPRRSAIAPVIGVVGLVALGVGQLVPVRHGVEDTLTSASRKALAATGLGAVQVSFTGQDGTLTATGLTAEQQRQALAVVRNLSVDGHRAVRVATFSGGLGSGTSASGTPSVTTSSSPSVTASASTTPTSTPALPAGQPAVSAAATGGTVTLTGTVPDEQTHQALVGAATRRFGAGHVLDRLSVVAGLSPAGLAGFAGLFALVGRSDQVTAALSAGVLTLTGTVSSAAARGAVDTGAVAVVGGDRSKVTDRLTVVTTTLQSQLSAVGLINFDTASDTLTPQGDAAVSAAAALLRANPRARIRIEGYTDDQGAALINLQLSAGRAQTVLATLGFRGVDPSRLVAVGYGEAKPAAPNDTAAHRALNRRVELVVVS